VNSLLAWTNGMAFVAGVVSPDDVAILFVGGAAFVQAHADRRSPWRWTVLTLTAWGAGTGARAVVGLVVGNPQVALSPTWVNEIVVIAFAGAVAGAFLKWASVRIAREAYVHRPDSQRRSRP
jgi:hypothetical protein